MLTASVMPFKSGIIDGEVVVLDDQHRSSFNELQAELSSRRSNRLVFVAFDLLHLDGMDLRKLPLVVRRERLERLVQTADGGRIQFSEALPGTPQQVFDVVDRAGLEGVVCKQADSRYVSGKTKAWLKVKAFEEAEFELVGVRRERGKPAMALLARNGRPAGSPSSPCRPASASDCGSASSSPPSPRARPIRSNWSSPASSAASAT